MGKYADLFEEEAPAPARKGKYADLFEDDAPKMRVGGAANPDEPLTVQGSVAGEGTRKRASSIERLKTNYSAGLDALGQGLQHPIDTVTDPSRRREFERGVSDVVTLGLAEKAARAVDPEAFGAKTAASDAANAPGFRALGGATGSFLPSPARLVAGGVAKAVPGSGAIPGAVRGGLTYEATAPAAAAINAEPGKRGAAALDAAIDPVGLFTAAGTGAALPVANLPSMSKERVKTAAKQGIVTGEQNAGKRLVEKVARAGGTDEKFIDDLLNRYPGLEATAAIRGKVNPGAVLKSVDTKLDGSLGQLDRMYGDMVKAKAVVRPQNILDSFDKAVGDAIKSGDQPALRILRQEKAAFSREYKNFGALAPDTMRGLKETAGKAAYNGTRAPEQVRAQIWRVYADAVEQQAKGSGVDVGKMRQLNKDSQILIAAKNALTERETMRRAGRLSIGEHAMRAGMAASGDTGALKATVGLPVVRSLKQAGRAADVALSHVPGIGKLRLPTAPVGSAALGAGLGQELRRDVDVDEQRRKAKALGL